MNYDLDDPEGMNNAKLWLRNMLSLLKEGGIWGVPRSESEYRISFREKKAVKLSGQSEPSIRRVFEAIGWTVEDD